MEKTMPKRSLLFSTDSKNMWELKRAHHGVSKKHLATKAKAMLKEGNIIRKLCNGFGRERILRSGFWSV